MTDDDYLYAVLNCDDTSGEATDAAARAVYRLRVRAEKAEAAIARVRDVCMSSHVDDKGKRVVYRKDGTR